MSQDELGPLSRGLLDAARGGLGPDAAAAARVRAKVALAVTAGAVGAAGAGASATAATVSTVGKLSLLGKLAAALVVASAVGGGGYVVHAQLASRAPVDAPVIAVRAPVTRTPVMRTPARAVAPPVAAAPALLPVQEDPELSIELDDPMVAPPARLPRPARSAPPAAHIAPAANAPPAAATAEVAAVDEPSADPPPPPPPPVRRADLAREVALIDGAVAALRRGQPNAALSTLAVYARETADRGQLAEDAAAIEIEALCRLHDPTVADRLAQFDARWPHSIERGRAVLACAP